MAKKSKIRSQIEIERRFVVSSIDPDIRRSPGRRIVQGYLDSALDKSLRVRLIDGRRAELTVKTGFGLEREEKTIKMPYESGLFVLEACADSVVKTRYDRDGWEVDFFEGPLSGLVLAEFEMPKRDYRLVLPPWIHNATEVTDSVSNRLLARLARSLDKSGSSRPVREMLPKRLPRIVLTGGPCSGKSTALAKLREEFGQRVHCVPEVATIVIGQVGCLPPPSDFVVAQHQFQRTIYQVQRGFEEISELQAARDGKAALLLDRGTVDSAAYLKGGLSEFSRICGTSPEIEYSQYDLVIILEVPSQKVYDAQRKNNPARSENYGQAMALGAAIKEVWRGHQNRYIVHDFDTWERRYEVIRKVVTDFLK